MEVKHWLSRIHTSIHSNAFNKQFSRHSICIHIPTSSQTHTLPAFKDVAFMQQQLSHTATFMQLNSCQCIQAATTTQSSYHSIHTLSRIQAAAFMEQHSHNHIESTFTTLQHRHHSICATALMPTHDMLALAPTHSHLSICFGIFMLMNSLSYIHPLYAWDTLRSTLDVQHQPWVPRGPWA